MSIRFNELADTIEKIAPSFLMDEWDNSGIQVQSSMNDIQKILVALELTREVIDEAMSLGAKAIILHHPFIFQELKSIRQDNIVGEYLTLLIKNDISVFAAHTTFDKAMGGNNDYLLGLLDIKGHSLVGTGSFNEFGVGRLFDLKKALTAGEIVLLVTKALEIPLGEIRYAGNPETVVKKIGVCTGAGAGLISEAAENGCEMFITGDVKYHDAHLAKTKGIFVLDAGHYYTERTFSVNFAEKLTKLLGERAEIIASQINVNPFGY